MKDAVKDCQLKFRLTTELKERIEKYCQEHRMNYSEFIRYACESIFNGEGGASE